jgi:NAD(P)-dependent dehydrogenase (short-subunit alcohol dehydrogenase family)
VSRLEGRVAVVTGGGNGIGRACCERFAEEGADVVVADLLDDAGAETVQLVEKAGSSGLFVHVDAASPEDNAGLVQQAVDRFGKVDVLVTAAGISHADYKSGDRSRDEEMLTRALESREDPARRMLELELPQWQKVLDVNLTGAFLFSQAAGREMLKRQHGRIINVSSIAGLHVSVNGPHYVGYAASKAGLLGLTRELAGTWGRQGIRVNAIAPGFFPSRLTEAVLPKAEASLKANCPIPRAGIEGELKGVAVFLASDASNYITGQAIVVDGGRTIA